MGKKQGILDQFAQSSTDDFPYDAHGPGYRCSFELTDGLMIPCGIIRRKQYLVDLALERFETEKAGKGVFSNSESPYRNIVSHFVTSGNRINEFAIKSVSASRYALPLSLLEQIQGETVMSWTGWVFEMSDGKLFSYGSSFSFEFFDIPDGYEFRDVARVHNNSFVAPDGTVTNIRDNPEKWREWMQSDAGGSMFRERPYFECYID